jgi:hypothetical protein
MIITKLMISLMEMNQEIKISKIKNSLDLEEGIKIIKVISEEVIEKEINSEVVIEKEINSEVEIEKEINSEVVIEKEINSEVEIEKEINSKVIKINKDRVK